jgi:hypothetical protein
MVQPSRGTAWKDQRKPSYTSRIDLPRKVSLVMHVIK